MKRPFAYFQWNDRWGIWEEVAAGAAGKPGVVAAFTAEGVDDAALPSATDEVITERRRVAQ